MPGYLSYVLNISLEASLPPHLTIVQANKVYIQVLGHITYTYAQWM